jgi:hypothetical protein
MLGSPYTPILTRLRGQACWEELCWCFPGTGKTNPYTFQLDWQEPRENSWPSRKHKCCRAPGSMAGGACRQDMESPVCGKNLPSLSSQLEGNPGSAYFTALGTRHLCEGNDWRPTHWVWSTNPAWGARMSPPPCFQLSQCIWRTM